MVPPNFKLCQGLLQLTKICRCAPFVQQKDKNALNNFSKRQKYTYKFGKKKKKTNKKIEFKTHQHCRGSVIGSLEHLNQKRLRKALPASRLDRGVTLKPDLSYPAPPCSCSSSSCQQIHKHTQLSLFQDIPI
jgi:hypothetical protein